MNKRTKQKIINILIAVLFIISWKFMLTSIEMHKNLCGTLLNRVEIVYEYAYAILYFVLLPIGMLSLLVFSTSQAKNIDYLSNFIIITGLFVSMFLVYIAYIPIFDCGSNIPLVAE